MGSGYGQLKKSSTLSCTFKIPRWCCGIMRSPIWWNREFRILLSFFGWSQELSNHGSISKSVIFLVTIWTSPSSMCSELSLSQWEWAYAGPHSHLPTFIPKSLTPAWKPWLKGRFNSSSGSEWGLHRRTEWAHNLSEHQITQPSRSWALGFSISKPVLSVQSPKGSYSRGSFPRPCTYRWGYR